MQSMWAKMFPTLLELRQSATVLCYSDADGFTYVPLNSFLEVPSYVSFKQQVTALQSQYPAETIQLLGYFFDLRLPRVRDRRVSALQREEDKQTKVVEVEFDANQQLQVTAVTSMPPNDPVVIPRDGAWSQLNTPFMVKREPAHQARPFTFNVLSHFPLKPFRQCPRGIIIVQLLPYKDI